jgi:hypothetical protein
MAAVYPRTLRAAAPALLALAVAACDGTDAPAREAATPPAPAAGGGIALGTVPTLPPGLPAPYLSGVVPTAIPALPDSVTTPEGSRPWFDVFSWQSFIALNWPASTQGRGNPQSPADSSAFLDMQNGALVVWGSYKESGELFGQGSARPTAFDDWSSPVEPCGGNLQNGQKAFTFTSKGNSLFNDAAQSFSYPLIDQQRGYARYEVRYNRAQYDTIRGPDGDSTRWVYLSTNLRRNTPFVMPASSAAGNQGAIMVKAAWRPLTAQDDTTRFFHVMALVANDTAAQGCSQVRMGLVGLHIAQKLDSFPQWIWSSFEHVSNVPGTGSRKQGTGSGYSYNNGLDTPQSVYGWSYRPPTLALPPNARPVQVSRVNDIPATPAGASTQDINTIYQAFLQNTVWSNYQLVITQWPSDPGTFTLTDQGGVYPQDAGGAFPTWNAVNTVIETYMQTRENAAGGGGNSCMSCHYQTGNTDFSWGLRRRAHP